MAYIFPQRYYLDTSIWIDMYEDRRGYQGEPLGDYAWQLLSFVKAVDASIIVSNVVRRELEQGYSIDIVRGMMSHFKGILIVVVATKEQDEEARYLSKVKSIPSGDAAHAVIARDNHCILVARDNHFRKLGDICSAIKPEDVLGIS